MITFGERLRQLRLSKELTQSELGDKIGYKLRMVQFLESNQREPNLETIHKLCDLFDCSSDYLLGRTVDEKDINLRKEKLFRIKVAAKALNSYINKTPPFRVLDEYSDAVRDSDIEFNSMEFISNRFKHAENMIKRIEEEMLSLESNESKQEDPS
jgi:transcriptional regulator with XRE-family HTH domain